MELFRNIRLKLGRSALNRRLARQKRKVHYSEFGNVKTIGVVWDASKVSDFLGLSAFHHKMNEKGIDVKILGYYPGRELPDQYTAIRYLTCLRRNELNTYYIPASPEAEKFISTRFDILIDLNFRNVFPLHCISALSQAAFKVGMLDDEPAYDLMMDMKVPQDTGNYLHQVVHYLEMIISDPGKKENQAS